MQITGSMGGIFQAVSNRLTGTSSGVTQTSSSDSSSSSSNSSGVKTYDFTSMSRAQMRSVSDTLYKSGQITFDQMTDLQMAGPLGKAGPNGEFIPFTAEERAAVDQEPMNYQQIANNAVSNIESSGRQTDPTSGYQDWIKIRSLLQNLQGSVSGINVSA